VPTVYRTSSVRSVKPRNCWARGSRFQRAFPYPRSEGNRAARNAKAEPAGSAYGLDCEPVAAGAGSAGADGRGGEGLSWATLCPLLGQLLPESLHALPYRIGQRPPGDAVPARFEGRDAVLSREPSEVERGG
jgi:hypothetical protein